MDDRKLNGLKSLGIAFLPRNRVVLPGSSLFVINGPREDTKGSWFQIRFILFMKINMVLVGQPYWKP